MRRFTALFGFAFVLFASSAVASEKAHPAPVSAGLGEGVRFRTNDGAFDLQVRARIQARFTFLTAKEDPLTGEPTDLAAQEFQIRRQRLLLKGHVFDKKFLYYIQYGFSNLDMEPDLRIPLRDAYVTWNGARDLQIRFGQGKVPFNRQRVISSSALQFPDRSIANGELNLDRDVGIQLFSRDLFGLGGRLGYNLGLFGGDGRNRLSTHSGMLYIARIEARPFGEFDDYNESDWGRSPKPRLSFGFAVAYNVNTRRDRSTLGETRKLGGINYTHGVADLMFKMSGFSLQSELMFRQADAGQSLVTGLDASGKPVREFARNAWGWFVQAGQFLTEHFEVAARVGEVRPRGITATDLRKQRELGGGVSYYWLEHALKLQADYFLLTEDTAVTGGASVTTTRHQARVQFQLYF